MKKFYILAIAVLTSTITFAQEFNISPNKHQVYSVTSTDFNEVAVDITLDSAVDLTLDWKILENTMPQSWSYSLCDYDNCYVGIPDSGTMMSITKAEMQSGTHPFYRLTMMISDKDYNSGLVKIHFYNTNDKQQGDTISFAVDYPQPNSVNLLNKTARLVYPNPSTGILNLLKTVEVGSKYRVINLQGKEILNQCFADEVSEIDLNSLSKGTYILELQGSNGLIQRQKIVLQ